MIYDNGAEMIQKIHHLYSGRASWSEFLFKEKANKFYEQKVIFDNAVKQMDEKYGEESNYKEDREYFIERLRKDILSQAEEEFSSFKAQVDYNFETLVKFRKDYKIPAIAPNGYRYYP